MTMHVNLSNEMESYIKSKVASGFYGNATEVIRDAIRRMQAEESRTAAWQAAIAKGDAQLDRGEGAPQVRILGGEDSGGGALEVRALAPSGDRHPDPGHPGVRISSERGETGKVGLALEPYGYRWLRLRHPGQRLPP